VRIAVVGGAYEREPVREGRAERAGLAYVRA